ncbi:MAG TPA: Sua5/YciO/YrdC/YwlC family protein [Gammaproteobacteria bacterium]|nr:Sua5/YciO/YrdC/YwlC family protein [Gammaproteobacteria bacterium]
MNASLPAHPSGGATRWQLRRARDVVLGGGVLAYPTEAVFGLGCDPWLEPAVARILALKGRSAAKGLILIAAEWAQVAPLLAPMDAPTRERVQATWPGPVTWVCPAAPGLPVSLTGGRDTLAVRVTAHPLAAALCHACGGPVVSTSANRSGHRPCRSALEVRLRLGRDVDRILPGALGGLGGPTEIRDAASGAVLRSSPPAGGTRA